MNEKDNKSKLELKDWLKERLTALRGEICRTIMYSTAIVTSSLECGFGVESRPVYH